MNIKKCTSCQETKDLEQFNNSKRGLFGKKSKCKNCTSNYNHEYSKTRWEQDKEYRDKKIKNAVDWVKKNPDKRALTAKKRNNKELVNNPEKVKARALVNQKVRFNRIPKVSSLICSCGNQAKHYHHHMGYDWHNRYNVIPVCVSCHNFLDKSIA
jgi:hypothetical protein